MLAAPTTSTPATYRDCLDYLYGLQRFGIKLGLENMRSLLAAAGRPETAFRSIHVAGTNGKGSVCATLASILQRAGVRTGLYTSPHLHDFGERIRIDGVPAGEAQIVALTAELRREAERIPATFFEFTTALALLHFARSGVAWAVLETGLGGRLDATNAVRPEVAVITSICHDHAAHLGTTLAAIAAEKAGIIKPGVPVVCAPQAPEALDVVLRRAAEIGAPCYLLGRDFHFQAVDDGSCAFSGLGLEVAGLVPGLEGDHQRTNLALALAAAALLRRRGLPLREGDLRAGAAGVNWPGRLEWWRNGRDILLDGAHNEGGAQALAAYLQRQGDGRRILWVAGLKADKDPAALLAPLLPRVTALHCCPPPVDAALDPAILARAGNAAGVPAAVHPDVPAALAAALAESGEGDLVLVAGSLFLVAAAREYLAHRELRAEVAP